MAFEERTWGVLPPGFQKVADGNGSLMVVREDVARDLAFETCTQASQRFEATDSTLHGRARLGSLKLSNGDTALVRSYRHGGLLRFLTRDLFLSWPPRPFRELAITEEVRRRGIPTVEVYAACVRRTLGSFYRGWLVTRQLQGAQDLWEAIQSGQFHTLGAARVLQAVADGVRGLHREGVYHRDLNLKNILVRRETDGVKGYIIDFDRAVLFFGAIPPTLAQRNLNRLLRSVHKLDPAQRYFSAANWEQFVACYYDHAEGPRP